MTTPRERSFAEQQADDNLDLIMRWIQRISESGGVYRISEAELYAFARAVMSTKFHTEREQVPALLMDNSRRAFPHAHAAWESFGDPLWHADEILGGRPDDAVPMYVTKWLDMAFSVYARRARYYSS